MRAFVSLTAETQCIAGAQTADTHRASGAYAFRPDLAHTVNHERLTASTRSAITSAIARHAVAAGEGALRTCRIPSSSEKTKSSISRPSPDTAWARTPAPAGLRSLACTAGT